MSSFEEWFQRRLINIGEIYDGMVGLFSLGIFHPGLAFRLTIYFQMKTAMKMLRLKETAEEYKSNRTEWKYMLSSNKVNK